MVTKKNLIYLALLQFTIWTVYHILNGAYWYFMQPDNFQYILKYKLFQLFIPCLISSSIIILLYMVCIHYFKKKYQLILGFCASVIISSFLYFVISKISFDILWSAESKPFELKSVVKGITNHLFLFVLLNGSCYFIYYWNKKKIEIKNLAKRLAKSPKNTPLVINNDSKIYIPNRYTSNYIEISSIKYIQANSYLSYVFTVDNNKISSNLSLKQWEEKLPHNNFFRIHKSTIVNLNCVHKIDKEQNQTYKVYLKKSSMPLIMSRRIGVDFMKVYRTDHFGVSAIH